MSEHCPVVILCGGLGTRMREETEFRPKPMVPVGGRPILWHIMKTYASQGFSEFVLALGYKGEMIRNYFIHYELMHNDVTLELGRPESVAIHHGHAEAGWRVTLADTGEKALKGARVKRLARYLPGETFMLTYGDGLGNVDLRALLAFHRSHGRTATVTGVNPTARLARFGELDVAGDRVQEFFEKPTVTGKYINGGYFVFNRSLLDLLSERDDCDLEYGPLEQLAHAGELMVYKHDGFWACMDTMRDVDYLNGLWEQGRAGWKTW